MSVVEAENLRVQLAAAEARLHPGTSPASSSFAAGFQGSPGAAPSPWPLPSGKEPAAQLSDGDHE